ncbi:MAG: helix-turn-helix domain-containing protein [Planctomycetota bacterium]
MEYDGDVWPLMRLAFTWCPGDGAATSADVMVVQDVAALLELAENTVLAMANARALSASKIRRQQRIRPSDLRIAG